MVKADIPELRTAGACDFNRLGHSGHGGHTGHTMSYLHNTLSCKLAQANHDYYERKGRLKSDQRNAVVVCPVLFFSSKNEVVFLFHMKFRMFESAYSFVFLVTEVECFCLPLLLGYH